MNHLIIYKCKIIKKINKIQYFSKNSLKIYRIKELIKKDIEIHGLTIFLSNTSKQNKVIYSQLLYKKHKNKKTRLF